MIRVAAEFTRAPVMESLWGLAAVAWLAAFAWWVGTFAPLYVRRRADGEPG